MSDIDKIKISELKQIQISFKTRSGRKSIILAFDSSSDEETENIDIAESEDINDYIDALCWSIKKKKITLQMLTVFDRELVKARLLKDIL